MNILYFLICIFAFTNVYSFTVMIDPGHGGKDMGAINSIKINGTYKKIYEKDIALEICKKINDRLKDYGFSSFLTRTNDRNIPLHERARMTEKIMADIFISLHINSDKFKSTNGFETYYLDNSRGVAVKKVEEVEQLTKSSPEESTIESKILTDLVISQTVKLSRTLANSIHKYIKEDIGNAFKLKDRGVKPGLLYVLALSKRPSILLEVGFMSNKRELKKVLNSEFQKKYAQAIAAGLVEYLRITNPSSMLARSFPLKTENNNFVLKNKTK